MKAPAERLGQLVKDCPGHTTEKKTLQGKFAVPPLSARQKALSSY